MSQKCSANRLSWRTRRSESAHHHDEERRQSGIEIRLERLGVIIENSCHDYSHVVHLSSGCERKLTLLSCDKDTQPYTWVLGVVWLGLESLRKANDREAGSRLNVCTSVKCLFKPDVGIRE